MSVIVLYVFKLGNPQDIKKLKFSQEFKDLDKIVSLKINDEFMQIDLFNHLSLGEKKTMLITRQLKGSTGINLMVCGSPATM